MAPRRSSSSGGGSVGDSSNSDGSIWLVETQLYGWSSMFGYAIADIVIIGIYLIALCAVAVWAMGTVRRSKATKSVLGWTKYGIAICLILTFYGFNFAQRIIQTDAPAVVNVYFLLATIIEDVVYPATTWTLFTIYSLLFYCSINPDETKRARHRGFFKAHCILCVMLTALWLGCLALDILTTVDAVTTAGFEFEADDIQNDSYASIGDDLDVAFQAVLLAAAVEVLLIAIWRLVTTRRNSRETSKNAMKFLVFVALPFFIWRLFSLAYAAAFELSDGLLETWGALIAFDIITGACIVLIFIGIVIVSKGFEPADLRPWNGNQGFAQPPPPPPPFAYSPAAAAPGQPYMQQYPYNGHVSPISTAQTYPQELHSQAQRVLEMPVRHVQHEVPP